MPERITHEEHHLRAMLMGRRYEWHDGSYCLPNDNGWSNVGMIDALTLEPLTEVEADQRMDDWGTRHKNEISEDYWAWQKDTPYGTMK